MVPVEMRTLGVPRHQSLALKSEAVRRVEGMAVKYGLRVCARCYGHPGTLPFHYARCAV